MPIGLGAMKAENLPPRDKDLAGRMEFMKMNWIKKRAKNTVLPLTPLYKPEPLERVDAGSVMHQEGLKI